MQGDSQLVWSSQGEVSGTPLHSEQGEARDQTSNPQLPANLLYLLSHMPPRPRTF